MNRNLVFLELNEVPYRVLDAYREFKPQSVLSMLMSAADQYETAAADCVALDPWISWPTVHRGVNDELHGILHLGQDLESVDKRYPPIWRLLHNHDLSVGVFGSLHSSSIPANIGDYSFYLPDYFGTSTYCHPGILTSFQELNLAMTRQSARNVSRRIPLRSLMHLIAAVPALGLRPSTLADAGAQLAREAVNRSMRIRRRAYQPLIMMDIFIKQLERSRPNFATFYTNHVAAAMHRYWGAMFPGDFQDGELDPRWIGRYSKEILFSMEKLDAILRRLANFLEKNPSYLLVVASSMGQAAIPAMQTYEFLTLTNPGKFLRLLGVPAEAWEARPAMVPCCCVSVAPECQEVLLSNLRKCAIGDNIFRRDRRPVGPMSFDLRENGFFQFFIQFDNYTGPKVMSVDGARVGFEDAGLGFMAHEDGVNCTAQHVPQGSLWIYDPKAKEPKKGQRRTISVLDVAPSILAGFDIESPPYMSGRPSISINP